MHFCTTPNRLFILFLTHTTAAVDSIGYFIKENPSQSCDLHDLLVHVYHELVLVFLEMPLIEDLIEVKGSQEVRVDQPEDEKELQYFVQKGTI